MQDKLQLHHLPRYEKKRLVKGWHATQTPSSDSNAADDQMANIRSLFAPPAGALAYETERTGTWRSTLESSDQEQVIAVVQQEKLPKTVGQVRHAYRARARKEEALEVANAIRKRNMRQEMLKGPRWRNGDQATKDEAQLEKIVNSHQEVGKEECQDEVKTAALLQSESDGQLRLTDLNVHEIATDATCRDEVLRRIRRQLAEGGAVLLQSDCDSTTEKVRNARLMMQTLCTQSLVYCVRDQDVVPDVLTQQNSTRLVLRLVPRHQRTT